MRAVRLIINHLTMILFPIIGPVTAFYNRGLDVVHINVRSIDDWKEICFFFSVSTCMPLIYLLIMLGWIAGKFIEGFTPLIAIGLLGLEKDDKEGQYILRFIDNSLFRGVQWMKEINGFDEGYAQLKYEMKEILIRCCRKI